jgi:peptide/nickel transport system substrate-binding protein
VRPDLSYEPVLVKHVTVETNPFALTYQLKPEAEWSDGVPVSADDLIFTLEAIRNPSNNILDRAGYDKITGTTKLDAKTVRFVFSEPFSAWKSLFPQVLPNHVLAGQDFDTTLLDSIPVASGPFMFESWTLGAQLSLVRNDGWWGPHGASLPQVVFRFILDTNARFQALASGELTLLHSPAQLQLLDLPPEILVSWIPGAGMEHVDVNLESPTMPLLGQAWFRQAFAYALDRDAAVAEAYGALSPGISADDSLVYLREQPQYSPHFGGYGYDPSQVLQIMQRNGCVTGIDGIWSCGGTRASIRFATTTGSAIRSLIQDSFIAQAKAAGFELTPDNSSAGTLFGTRLPAGDFDLVMYQWVRTGDPFGLKSMYGCGGELNYGKYCSNQVTAALDAADTQTNEGARAALVNQADAIMAHDVPSLPLYQHPTFLAHWPDLQGVVDNIGRQGITWNIEQWRLSGGGGPTITSFSPTSGPVGTTVTINGTGFTGASSVKFNGTAATTWVIYSSTRIYAKVPTGATTGPISVTNPAGTGQSAASFTVTGGGGAPKISSFSPTSGPVGTIVSVYGSGFTGTTAVKFNGTSAQFLVSSSTKLYAKVPAGATTGKISVTAPGGTGTSAANFSVT